MKKVLAITLTLTMLFAMTAMAEEINIKNPSKNVTATYQKGIEGGTVYSVDISWGSLEYTYNAESKGTWDPTTHEYKDAVKEASWICDNGADTIKVTNHSNAAVNVSMGYAPSETYTNITGTFENGSFALGSAEGKETTDITLTNAAKLTLNGSLTETTGSVTVGSVTVTIEGISTEPEDDFTSNEPIPLISNITTTNDTIDAYNPLIISLSGSNLDMLTKDTLSSYGSLSLYYSSSKIDINFTSAYVKYNAETSESATITIESAYFGSSMGTTRNMSKMIFTNISNSTEIECITSIEF